MDTRAAPQLMWPLLHRAKELRELRLDHVGGLAPTEGHRLAIHTALSSHPPTLSKGSLTTWRLSSSTWESSPGTRSFGHSVLDLQCLRVHCKDPRSHPFAFSSSPSTHSLSSSAVLSFRCLPRREPTEFEGGTASVFLSFVQSSPGLQTLEVWGLSTSDRVALAAGQQLQGFRHVDRGAAGGPIKFWRGPGHEGGETWPKMVRAPSQP